VLAIGSGIGLLAVAWLAITMKSAVTAKLAFLSAVAGGTVLLSLRPRRDKFEPPGRGSSKTRSPSCSR
jgi:hypothetical protein